MHLKKEHCVKFVGQWVHVHSVYGMHEGVLHRALHDGIILVHHVQLASTSDAQVDDFQLGLWEDQPDHGHTAHASPLDIHRLDATPAQFLLPAPGLFVPYPGLFGIWPRPAFVI
ncbi:MAG: hypothetical protein K6T78_03005 [Alicyclobacillus sp.]|nr:hypothetical protein [Alicyclobacillus sp.]